MGGGRWLLSTKMSTFAADLVRGGQKSERTKRFRLTEKPV